MYKKKKNTHTSLRKQKKSAGRKGDMIHEKVEKINGWYVMCVIH